MSEFYVDELPLSELINAPERVMGKNAVNSSLHFCSPAHGGWGVVRVACLLPETHLVFVCPAACGRHGAIAAIEGGYRHKITYVCIDESEIVLGGYEDAIKTGVDDIMATLSPRPKALMLFLACIDDLLASDHAATLAHIEEKHKIPVRLARMNPISLDGNLPPPQRVQQTMYQFLSPAELPAKLPQDTQKKSGVIAMGSFVPPARNSELAAFLRHFGTELRHPSFCPTFADFTALGGSAAALVLRPEGNAAGAYLQSELKMPVLHAVTAYDKATILARYAAIASFLTNEIVTTEDSNAIVRGYCKKTAEIAADAARELKGKTVAVDSGATASPFSLALALIESGIEVNRVYTNQPASHEKDAFLRLAQLRSGIIVSNPIHAKRAASCPASPLSDIAIGFEAAYATGAPITVPVSFDAISGIHGDSGLYGFEGYGLLLQEIIRGVRSPGKTLRQQIKDYGLVV